MTDIKLLITKIYLWILRKEFIKKEKQKIEDIGFLEYIIYSSKSKNPSAQALPFMYIIVNQSIFKKYSKWVQKYVLLHEFAHTKVKKIFFILLGLLIILSALFWSVFILGLITNIIIYLIKNQFVLVKELKILGLNSLILLLFLVIFSWIIEIHADFYAINKLGLTKVKSIYNEIKRKKQHRFIKILNWFTRPPMKFTMKIYSILNKFRKKVPNS